MNPSTALATVLVDELARCGVRDAVLAPGSRSAPLAYALFEADRAGRIRLHVRIDERGAGFLALGLAKVSRRPVPVVCTSGTAAANLHPAVLEAHHTGVPLILLTADRPPELRGVGANQATDQIKLYGEAVRLFCEVGAPEERPGQNAYWRSLACRSVAAARGVRDRDPGPVHLNLAFREPLVPDRWDGAGSDLSDRTGAGRRWPESLEGRPHGARWTQVDRLGGEHFAWLEPGPRTVVLAGDGADPKARWLAETAGWPLVAEPSSGARSGPNALGPYRLLLDLDDQPLVRSVQRVVVYGRPTLSRPVSRLLSREDVEIVVVSRSGSWPDPGRQATRVGPMVALAGTPDGAGRAEPDSWLAGWLTADREARQAVEKVLAGEPEPTGPAIAREVAAAVPEGGLLVAGSSNPIRDLDLAGLPWQNPLLDESGYVDVRRQRRVIANRGLSGIDGTVSTAMGAALAHRRGPAYGLVGDVTFLHDLSAWVRGPQEPAPDGPDLTLVVVNDNGGGVFATLEQGGPGYGDAFERLFGTPHGVDLEAFAAAVHAPYRRATSLAELRAGLDRARGLRIVEVPVDRARSRELHAALRSAVAAVA